MKSNFLFCAAFCLLLTACGYDGDEEKVAKRQEDLQEMSQEMNQTLTTISSLKIQLRDSLDALSAADDSLAQQRFDKYRLLLAELEEAETAYENWREEVSYEVENMNHEEAMEYYDQQEDKAQVVRMDMRQTIDYVQEQLQSPLVENP